MVASCSTPAGRELAKGQPTVGAHLVLGRRPHQSMGRQLDRQGLEITCSPARTSGSRRWPGLLPRFYDPGEGAILLDQVDLRDYRLADLRRQFAIVLQEPVLFSTSISENIAYGRPGANEAQIIAAAAAAGAHKFISRLPRGYETLVAPTARAHSASATWCSRSRTAGWWPPPRRKEP
jgi:hypothetical protein